jgi:hypothetical protein
MRDIQRHRAAYGALSPPDCRTSARDVVNACSTFPARSVILLQAERQCTFNICEKPRITSVQGADIFRGDWIGLLAQWVDDYILYYSTVNPLQAPPGTQRQPQRRRHSSLPLYVDTLRYSPLPYQVSFRCSPSHENIPFLFDMLSLSDYHYTYHFRIARSLPFQNGHL